MASSARARTRVDAAILGGCIVLSLVAVGLPENNREPIAAALRRTVVAPLVGLDRSAEQWRTAWVTNAGRQLLTDSLAARAAQVPALATENTELRGLLGLGSRLQWGFVPAEALNSSVPSGGVVTSLTLTAGSRAGVQPYDPVVAPDGLVGTIKRADPSISIAILYTDPDFRASAVSADGSTFGIIYPHSTSSGTSDPYMLELRGVATRVNLKPGTLIYTSGLGGTFPRGITIGTVVQEIRTAEVWTRTYLVRPAVLPSRVDAVYVLTAQRVTQGTGNIWGAAVNADSAAKRIAAAGDSLARAAAQLEAQARQAALDSVRRATIDSVMRAVGMARPPVDTARLSRDTTHVPRPDTIHRPPRP